MRAWAAAFLNRRLKRPRFSTLSIGRLFSDLKGGRQTVKTKSFYKIVILTLFILTLLFSLRASAAEEGILRLEGSLMGIDLQKNMMVVNEKTFIWDKKTIFLNESGAPVTPDQLKLHRKVHIEGERMGQKRLILIKEIRLLPK
jgi:hypothetical protein